MRCFNCHNTTDRNALDDISEDLQDRVTDEYGLIHLQGPEDMFDENGWVIICQACVDKVPRPATEQNEEIERLKANLAAIRCEIDARKECADLKVIRFYAEETTDMRVETLMRKREE